VGKDKLEITIEIIRIPEMSDESNVVKSERVMPLSSVI